MNITIDSPSSRQVAEALAAADDSLVRGDMLTAAGSAIAAEWLPALGSRSAGLQDTMTLVAGASTLVDPGGFTVMAAQSTVPLSGGLVPAERWYAVEFGARTRLMTFQTRSPKGTPYMVTKMINRGLPTRHQFGRIAFDAASEIGRHLVGAWVRAIVSAYRDSVGDDRHV